MSLIGKSYANIKKGIIYTIRHDRMLMWRGVNGRMKVREHDFITDANCVIANGWEQLLQPVMFKLQPKQTELIERVLKKQTVTNDVYELKYMLKHGYYHVDMRDRLNELRNTIK